MLIPSENYTYKEVREAVGSVLMHKYAEGYPGKRYYQGNNVADEIEGVAIKEALKTFGLREEEWGVNVQAHSGSEANLAILTALAELGSRILSLYLPDGGHLSHGWMHQGKRTTVVSRIYDVYYYHVKEKSGEIDYEEVERMARKLKPKVIISGGTAYTREIDHQRIGEAARKSQACYLADVSHEAGLIAAGANKSPFAYADVIMMTTHKTLRGPRGAVIFGRKELMEKINAAVFPGIQGGPHMNTIAGIAMALRKAQGAGFKKYGRQTVLNAQKLAEVLKKKGLKVVGGGTEKHLVLVDLRNMETNGWFAARALEECGIIVNKNSIPGETGTPYYPSGIRLGTPALTVRGMKEKEMEVMGELVANVVEVCRGFMAERDEEQRKKRIEEFKRLVGKDITVKRAAREVARLAREFPIPRE